MGFTELFIKIDSIRITINFFIISFSSFQITEIKQNRGIFLGFLRISRGS